jgi:hypothetical protein
VKSGKNGEAVRKLHIERGKKWMIIGTTLFGSISVAIGAFFVKSRYILQLKALALDTTKPIIEVTTTGLWHAKNAVFQVPASQFRPLGRGGIEQMKGKKYIKFRDYRHPLAYYYMTPTKSHVRDLKLIEQLFYSR